MKLEYTSGQEDGRNSSTFLPSSSTYEIMYTYMILHTFLILYLLLSRKKPIFEEFKKIVILFYTVFSSPRIYVRGSYFEGSEFCG